MPFRPALKHPPRWLLLLLLALLLLVAAVYFGLPDGLRSPTARALPTAATAAPDVRVSGPPPAARPPVITPAAAAPQPAQRRLVPCDPAKVALAIEAESQGPPALDKAKPTTPVFDAIRGALAGSSDAKTRAAALLLASMDSSIDPASCVGNDPSECVDRRREMSATMAAELAAMARHVPAAQAWALGACRASQADPLVHPACGALSPQHWADAAPDNVWPWLMLAGEARRRNDHSGLESAMHRASLARDWFHPDDELMRLIVAHLPADTSSTDFLAAIVRVVGKLHGGRAAGLSTLAQYCNANQDANRRQVCARLADGLLSNAKDMLTNGIAISVGQRSGLAKDRLDAAATQQAEARKGLASTVAAAGLLTSLQSAAAWQCRFNDQQAQVQLRSAEVGEVAAARELLAGVKP